MSKSAQAQVVPILNDFASTQRLASRAGSAARAAVREIRLRESASPGVELARSEVLLRRLDNTLGEVKAALIGPLLVNYCGWCCVAVLDEARRKPLWTPDGAYRVTQTKRMSVRILFRPGKKKPKGISGGFIDILRSHLVRLHNWKAV